MSLWIWSFFKSRRSSGRMKRQFKLEIRDWSMAIQNSSKRYSIINKLPIHGYLDVINDSPAPVQSLDCVTSRFANGSGSWLGRTYYSISRNHQLRRCREGRNVRYKHNTSINLRLSESPLTQLVSAINSSGSNWDPNLAPTERNRENISCFRLSTSEIQHPTCAV